MLRLPLCEPPSHIIAADYARHLVPKVRIGFPKEISTLTEPLGAQKPIFLIRKDCATNFLKVNLFLSGNFVPLTSDTK
jgi:hypothetical protein